MKTTNDGKLVNIILGIWVMIVSENLFFQDYMKILSISRKMINIYMYYIIYLPNQFVSEQCRLNL